MQDLNKWCSNDSQEGAQKLVMASAEPSLMYIDCVVIYLHNCTQSNKTQKDYTDVHQKHHKTQNPLHKNEYNGKSSHKNHKNTYTLRKKSTKSYKIHCNRQIFVGDRLILQCMLKTYTPKPLVNKYSRSHIRQ